MNIHRCGPRVVQNRVATAPGRLRHSWKSAMVVVIPTENINKPNLNGSTAVSAVARFGRKKCKPLKRSEEHKIAW